MTPPAVGTRAPSFRLPAAQGTEIALEDYRGRSVVLWFSKGLY
jgi:peroxiredoxin